LAAPMPQMKVLLEHPGDEDNLAWIKLFMGVFALIALFYEASRESEGNPVSLRWKKIIGGTFAIIGVVCYFQFFQIGYKEFYHRWEFFHYYVGSKYFKEIGYEGIYTCAAVAESELADGSAAPNDRPKQAVKVRKLRDLRVNLIVDTTDWTEHPEKCKGGNAAEGLRPFTPERWDSFKKDVAFFRRVSFGSYWIDMQKDHGYNPPPVWGVTGRLFAELHPADENYMKLLSCIDPILFSAMFGLIAWAFGWRVMCVGMLFWGTQDASPFYWTGGAFLRQDWLFYTIASACMIRKKKYFWGGAFLSYGTMLRVFPIFFFAGWFVSAAAYAYNRITKDGVKLELSLKGFLDLTHPNLRKVAAGAAIGAGALFAITIPVTGFSAWTSFAHHIAVHNKTPLTNHMGWKTIVAHRAEGRMQVAKDPRMQDPFEKWKTMRLDRVKELKVIYYGGLALMMGMFGYACWRIKSLWIVEALGSLPTTVLVELTDYYYSYFLFGAMLSKGRRPIEFALILAGILSEWCHNYYGFFDDRFVAMSVVFVLLAVFMVAMYMRRPWLRAGEILQTAPAVRVPSMPPPAAE
jgi:hypothetical protein